MLEKLPDAPAHCPALGDDPILIRNRQLPGMYLQVSVSHDVPNISCVRIEEVMERLGRKCADQIKFNASGGVAGPQGTPQTINFSVEEVRALVEEAEAWQTYAMAHAYTPRTIRRAVECGVRSIEHGNLIDKETAELMAEHGAYMVPTLSIFHTGSKFGKGLGFPDHSVAKVTAVLDASLTGVEICRDAGVRIGHGSDLLGPLHEHQSLEFLLKAEVLTPAETLASATTINAEIMGMEGQLGVVKAGAFADLLMIDGDPLRDLGVLQEQGRHLAAIMKSGRFVKNGLGTA